VAGPATEVNLKNRYLSGPQVDQLLADGLFGSPLVEASSLSAGPRQ
jgi:hypothetical protein